MTTVEFERLVEAVIPVSGRTSLTLTETPSNVGELMRLLERAVVVGNRRGAPLIEIQAPFAELPDCSDRFFHVPIADSSRDGVVRLTFERAEMHAAA